MGLTIHYELRQASNSIKKARSVVEALHQRAGELPFEEVGPIVHLQGEACDPAQYKDDAEARWLALQADCWLKDKRNQPYAEVPAREILAFGTLPGEGSEPANIGLCRYPAVVTHRGKEVKTRQGSGWHWRSFCKTQYAYNPTYGGIKHFLKCHLSVVKLLDYAKELGVLVDVSDEGDYWENRDLTGLAKQVGEQSALIAASIGALNDLFKGQIEAPI
jgi:hypothetical protein